VFSVSLEINLMVPITYYDIFIHRRPEVKEIYVDQITAKEMAGRGLWLQQGCRLGSVLLDDHT